MFNSEKPGIAKKFVGIILVAAAVILGTYTLDGQSALTGSGTRFGPTPEVPLPERFRLNQELNSREYEDGTQPSPTAYTILRVCTTLSDAPTNIRIGPGMDYPPFTTIAPDTKFEARAEENGFYQLGIVDPNTGEDGWISGTRAVCE
jgi:hypothetical protein